VPISKQTASKGSVRAFIRHLEREAAVFVGQDSNPDTVENVRIGILTREEGGSDYSAL
jgi:hypothetical protein